MFSFHKPKVYRSSTGCCICKAKSSSSRFTDSKKYEQDFVKCFLLEEDRSGKICNACVLLVKRWKKLPPGSSRNWRHVVDARAGPGIKSLTKFKAKNKKLKETPEKFEKIMKKKGIPVKKIINREESPAMSDDMTEDYAADTGSKGSSRAGSPADSDDIAVEKKRRLMNHLDFKINNFIDLTYFKRTKVCCGIIYVGMFGEAIIDPALYKPCLGCLARRQRNREEAVVPLNASPTHSSLASTSPCYSSASLSPPYSVESTTDSSVSAVSKISGKTFSDCSSDSGYEDIHLEGPKSTSNNKVIQTCKQQSQAVSVLTSGSIALASNLKNPITPILQFAPRPPLAN